MSKQRFWAVYTLLAVCQIIICNYLNFSPFVSLSILPAMVMCIPVNIKTPWAMVIAFLTALAVDFTTGTVPGLIALALVPVAFCRSGILKIIFGSDINSRQEALSIRLKGFGKVSGVLVISIALFFAIYIPADGAGTRPFMFNLLRFLASTVVSYILSLAAVEALSPRTR